jgi:glutathione S-transferase
MGKLKNDFITNKLGLTKTETSANFVLVPDLKTLCMTLARNDTAFLVGNKLTYVDIKLFATLEAIDKELPLVLPSFPLLSAFHKVLATRPNIKKYVESGKRF